MFKNLTIFRIASGLDVDADTVAAELGKMPFAATTAESPKSIGWVPPRGHAHGPLLETINGAWVMRFMLETRQVPASVVQRRVDEMVSHIEAATGRKPGKKERRDLKEDALAALLPQAFPRQVATWVWLDPATKRLVLDTTSMAVADDIITALVKLLEGFSVETLSTATSPSVAMAVWLAEQEGPAGFAIGKACELRSADESQAKVRYSNHPLMLEEVKAHIAQGKQPTCLALEWDDRVGFVLGDNLQLKKVTFADSVQQQSKDQGQRADDFDGNVLMATAELGPLIGDLVDALGGENHARPA